MEAKWGEIRSTSFQKQFANIKSKGTTKQEKKLSNFYYRAYEIEKKDAVFKPG